MRTEPKYKLKWPTDITREIEKRIDEIPRSEQARRMKINLGKIRPGLFETSQFDKNSLFDTSIFGIKTVYRNINNPKGRFNEGD